MKMKAEGKRSKKEEGDETRKGWGGNGCWVIKVYNDSITVVVIVTAKVLSNF